MQLKQKLYVAFAIYVGLALLVWQTITDEKLRLVTLLILGFFAFRTWINWRHRSRDESMAPKS